MRIHPLLMHLRLYIIYMRSLRFDLLVGPCISRLSSFVYRMLFVVCRLSSDVCCLSFVVGRLLFVICHLSTIVCCLSSVSFVFFVCHLLSVICHLLSVVYQLSSVVCHLSSSVPQLLPLYPSTLRFQCQRQRKKVQRLSCIAVLPPLLKNCTHAYYKILHILTA